MQIYNISTDQYGRELTQHGSADFPCAGYDERFSRFMLGEVPWHWHEEIEIVVVCEGAARVEVLGGMTALSRGEGLFINANTAHRLTQTGKTDCRIQNFVLHPELLGGVGGSKIFREYIDPVCSNKRFPAMKFTPEVPWQADLLTHFHRAFAAYTGAEAGFEMEVVSRLMEFWRLICVHNTGLFPSVSGSSADEGRIKLLMKHIDEHYMERLSVARLASLAGISESECFRLFKRTLKSPPNDYLLKIRLRKASLALLNSDRTIQTIALDSGFNSSAYFTRQFKAYFGTTPGGYRKAGPQGSGLSEGNKLSTQS